MGIFSKIAAFSHRAHEQMFLPNFDAGIAAGTKDFFAGLGKSSLMYGTPGAIVGATIAPDQHRASGAAAGFLAGVGVGDAIGLATSRHIMPKLVERMSAGSIDPVLGSYLGRGLAGGVAVSSAYQGYTNMKHARQGDMSLLGFAVGGLEDTAIGIASTIAGPAIGYGAYKLKVGRFTRSVT